jgi:tRNA A-37 threonylcarbamoyl transferase component Bud32
LREISVSEKLAEYFSAILSSGELNFVPHGATFDRISDLKRIGGVVNDVYSFSVTFRNEGYEQKNNLVLKTYGKALDPVLETYGDDENLKRCAKEFQVLRSLQRIGFPAPRAYLCECDSGVLGYPFVIMQGEESVSNNTGITDCFVQTLIRLHSLDIAKLDIGALKGPKDFCEFEKQRLLYLKIFMNLYPRHSKRVKNDFEFAIHWLESNVSNNHCPQYCLIHGDYRTPFNLILTGDSRLVVIDWEEAEIGDPAYDVGMAYARARLDYGREIADHFVQEYLRYSDKDFGQRLLFYELMAHLRLAISHSSVLSNPTRAYKIRGMKAFLSFPFLRLPFVAKRTGTNLDARWVECFEEFIGENFRR